MEGYICKKIIDKIETQSLQQTALKNLLEYTEYNDIIMNNPFITYKNKLIAMCILSKMPFSYAYMNIEPIIDKWNINYKLIELESIVYMIFYTEEYIIISFKGTTSLKDVINDLKFIQVDDCYNIPGKFHKGFHDLILTNGVAESIKKEIDDLNTDNKLNIYITGHSLGGSLATVFYAYLKGQKLSQIELITFGSPRVGDKELSNSLESTRIVQGNDIVTKLPIFCYKHLNTLLHIGDTRSISYFSDHYLEKYYIYLLEL